VGATTVFAALEGALEQIWNTRSIKRAGIRGWIRTRLLSLGLILALGFLLLVSLTVSTALATARALLAHRYVGVVALLGALDLVVSLALVSRSLRAHLSLDARRTVAMSWRFTRPANSKLRQLAEELTWEDRSWDRIKAS
jgi:uncharacterized BrkB/YihY/UPF0761 family membrane protein